jgi:glycine/D-amino acid oxidase-like deaminating enzyme
MRVTRREAAGIAMAAASGSASAATPRVHDVAVIGAGVFGAWTAHALKKRGRSVLLFDQYGAGHARASSGGESRVTRLSYGGDALYSEMARESLTAWSQLSLRLDQPILHRIGVLWFSPASDAYMAKSLQYLRDTRTPHAALDAAGLRARYPQMRFKDGEGGFLEEHSGALIAGRGVQATVADARLTVVRRSIGAPRRRADGAYDLGDGAAARALVYACGPWLGKLFPDVVGDRIVATRQEVLHFGPARGDSAFTPEELPVWADFNGGEIVYGMPELEGQGFKLAFDAHGERCDPDTMQRTVPQASIERARAYLAQRFPALAQAPLIHARVCQYENTSNGDFLIDRLPGHDNVWLVGGGSGHGFKHGPAVGKRVAAHVLDLALPVEPRFALAAKQLVQNRTVF